MKKLILASALFLLVSIAALPFALAAANPFMEVPVSHWAYDALARLAVRGVIKGYGHETSNDPQPMTRYEIASVIARSLADADADKMSKADIEMMRRLIAEFSDELRALGVTADSFDARFGELKADLGGWSIAGALGPPAPDAAAPRVRAMGVIGATAVAPNSAYPPETARYGTYDDNPVKLVSRDPLSTFSLDVNTTSYANVRRFLNSGRLPNPDAVRVEELINYFPAAAADTRPARIPSSPFYAAYELAPCPWNDNNALLWIAVSALEVDYSDAPPANLVFLVDVSGSMNSDERLPLAKSALKALVGKIRPDDSISLVTYAGATSVPLEATKGSEKAKILEAIDRLGAGGSTAGAAGLALAYEQAEKGFIKNGVNRILLCTDGDFNVGVSGTKELEAMVTKNRESGITLSVLGFGTGNLNDEMMTRISGVGNGNYSYVDSMSEARKVLDEEMTATLVTVAKDVKAQIEFNPKNVIEYRQLGYEKRQLDAADFNNDLVDAGDVGAGKRVTILYELTLAGAKPSVDPLRYRQSKAASDDELEAADMKSDELAYLKFRWKEPDGAKSSLAEMPLDKNAAADTFAGAGTGLRFSAAVAAYGQKLRSNPGLAGTKWSEIESWADKSRGDDPYRAEFLQLVKLASSLSK